MNKPTDKYKETDIGLLDTENIKYLIQQDILTTVKETETYAIKYEVIDRIETEKPVTTWSLFLWVAEDIRAKLQIKDINEVVTVMRCGWQMGDANYPVVISIENKGANLITNKSSSKDSSGDRSLDF